MPLAAPGVSVGADTYDRLRRDIIYGRLEAGRKLGLEQLRTTHGASVSTLRETLNRLVTEGLVVAEGQRGFSVAPMSETDLREIADLRILVEGHALKLSIEAGDTEWEGAVVAAHYKLHRMEDRMAAGDFTVRETWKQYDWEFHKCLVAACGSAALMEVHRTVFDKYLRYQLRQLTWRDRSSPAEHQALLAAALERDVETAQQVLRIHIQGGVEHSLEHNAHPEGSIVVK